MFICFVWQTASVGLVCGTVLTGRLSFEHALTVMFCKEAAWNQSSENYPAIYLINKQTNKLNKWINVRCSLLVLVAALSKAARVLELRVRTPPGAWMTVCCECCQVEVYETSPSLVQGSVSECGVSECDLETSWKKGAVTRWGLPRQK